MTALSRENSSPGNSERFQPLMMVESDSMLLSPRLADVSKLLALRICTQELYSNRLERASHLTEGLKQDKINWIAYSKTYEQRKKNIEGDTLI
jgi:hypothetical protein